MADKLNSKQRRLAKQAVRVASETQTAVIAAVVGKPKKVRKASAVQVVTLPDGTTKTLVAIPKPKKVRKSKPARSCECGCGAMTRGGRFLPGHDSRLKAWLLAVERGLVKIGDIPDGERQAVQAHLKAVSKPALTLL